MRTKSLLLSLKSPVIVAGFFCLLLVLNGCQTATPEEVTTQFWQALAQGQIENAKKQTTQNSQHLVNLQDIDIHSPVKTTEAVINDDDIASVDTSITRNKRSVTFETVLVKESGGWKVDYQQTQINISLIPFDSVVKSLENLGDAFGRQLQEQVPAIQKKMESIGEELKNQIDEFGRGLEKPADPVKPKPHPGTI